MTRNDYEEMMLFDRLTRPNQTNNSTLKVEPFTLYYFTCDKGAMGVKTMVLYVRRVNKRDTMCLE